MTSTYNTESQSWQVGKSLAECLCHMLENHVACDVTFAVQSTGNSHVKISAQKLILQARSPVFEAMFIGAFNETREDVVITDMDPEPFNDLLRYMYTDEVVLTGENVIPLLFAAKKYFLKSLVTKCEQFLETKLCVDNVCSILTHSLIQQDEELVNACLDLIAPNIAAVIENKSFQKLSHDGMCKVVGYDHVAHGVEAELFEACIEWGKRRTKDPDNATGEEIRGILGTECLHKIRFPYIPLKDFGVKFGHTSILTLDEKCAIYSLLVTHDKSYINYLSDLGFDVSSRMFRIKRFEHCSQRLYDEPLLTEDENVEEFTLSVNEPVQLRGFSIHGGKKGADQEVTITIHSSEEVEGTNIDIDKDEQKENDDERGSIIVHTKQKISAKEDYKPIMYFRKTSMALNSEYRVCVRINCMDKTVYCWNPIADMITDDLTVSSTSLLTPLHGRDNKAQVGFVSEILFQRLPDHD